MVRSDFYKQRQYVILLDLDDFSKWKEGKCLARKTGDYGRFDNIIENSVSFQSSLEFEEDKEAAEAFNIRQICSMFEDEAADRNIKEYNRGEYPAHTKYNDYMFVTWEEFDKTMKHYGTEAYVHQFKDSKKAVIVYTIK